jgi:hypothetical protein
MAALDAYLAANPDVAQEARRVTADHEFGSPEDGVMPAWHYQHYGQNEGRAAPALNDACANRATGNPRRAQPVGSVPQQHQLPVPLRPGAEGDRGQLRDQGRARQRGG